MKALVKKEAAPGLWLEDIPEPKIGVNDVLIRVDRTGICGTDVHIYNWDEWAKKTIPVPMAIGHEFVGEVVEVGSNVAGFNGKNMDVRTSVEPNAQITCFDIDRVVSGQGEWGAA